MNVAALRADTPGCEHVVHFNNAGAALMPRPVLQAQLDHLELEARIGGYESAAAAADATADTHQAVADLLGASADEIAIVENATRAWGAAFYGIDFREGDRILTAQASYASNYIAMLQVARRQGLHIDVAPNDSSGQVDVAALEGLITSRTRVIALTHIPTNGGLINPAADVGAVARSHGVPFLLDACQSAGQLPLNVDELGCDMLSATGRKFLRGPRGTGFLFVRRGLIPDLEPPFLDLHAAEWVDAGHYEPHGDHRRFETWEGNVAGKIALGVAARYAMDVGLAAIAERVQRLADDLRTRLQALPGVRVHDLGVQRSGIVTFSHESVPAARIKSGLLTRKFNTSLAIPSSSRLDADHRGLPEMVRASVHYYNTDDEVERFVEQVVAQVA
ncbi:MAG: aminotransferase class V-fold PLP-dependent enzyme [Rhodothermales bacterium]|nr:aminotransferase class V-fold PLP-dependent enzyme [Rhodothermales bacterium]MBO6780183.1 aminotransferase class V-fold PLP-dependent enzyme [Rhodothermales bacterium]